MIEIEVSDKNEILPNLVFKLNFYPNWRVGDSVSFGGLVREICFIFVEVKSPDIHLDKDEVATLKMDIVVR